MNLPVKQDRGGVTGFVLLCILSAVSCVEIERGVKNSAPPVRTEAYILFDSTFAPSSIVGTRDCGILAVASQWGTLVKTDLWANRVTAVNQLPRFMQGARLADDGGSRIIAWSTQPEALVSIEESLLKTSALSLPEQSGYGRIAGPAAPLSHGRTIALPFSDPRTPRPYVPGHPLSWAVMIASNGQAENIGQLEVREGTFLTWQRHIATVGSVGDTLLVATHADAVVQSWLVNSKLRTTLPTVRRLPGSVSLPELLSVPAPTERVHEFSWFQAGGTRGAIQHVPQLTSASFGPRGQLAAIRPVKIRMQSLRRFGFLERGAWAVEGSVLEVYDRAGRVLESYALPDNEFGWVVLDRHGRLFLGRRASPPRVDLVARSSNAHGTCAPFPSIVRISVVDTPWVSAD